MTKIFGLSLLLFATPVLAHLVPINPSTCGLTIGLSGATVAPPGPTDLVRVSFEPDASPTRSRMQICPADAADPSARCATSAAPRPFSFGGVVGAIALPTAFDLRMLSSGELDAAGVPITIDYLGSSKVVSFDLTTGFVESEEGTVLGSPIDAGGTFRIVGSGLGCIQALPCLDPVPLALELSCTLAPAPDLDQFALAPRLDKVRGTLKGGKAKLTIMLDSEFAMSEVASAPTVLRLSDASATLLELAVPMQSGPRGRLVSSDGSVTIIPLKRATERVQKVVLKGPLAAGAILAPGDGELALSVGGLTARRGVALKANRRGTKAGVRER
jgi:hypothetical protein